jgi:hypothetical protein
VTAISDFVTQAIVNEINCALVKAVLENDLEVNAKGSTKRVKLSVAM